MTALRSIQITDRLSVQLIAVRGGAQWATVTAPDSYGVQTVNWYATRGTAMRAARKTEGN